MSSNKNDSTISPGNGSRKGEGNPDEHEGKTTPAASGDIAFMETVPAQAEKSDGSSEITVPLSQMSSVAEQANPTDSSPVKVRSPPNEQARKCETTSTREPQQKKPDQKLEESERETRPSSPAEISSSASNTDIVNDNGTSCGTSLEVNPAPSDDTVNKQSPVTEVATTETIGSPPGDGTALPVPVETPTHELSTSIVCQTNEAIKSSSELQSSMSGDTVTNNQESVNEDDTKPAAVASSPGAIDQQGNSPSLSTNEPTVKSPPQEAPQAMPLSTTSDALQDKVIACYLCRRKFPSLQKLQKHERRSAMHRENLLRKQRGEKTPVTRKRKGERKENDDGRPVRKRIKTAAGSAVPAAGEASGEDAFVSGKPSTSTVLSPGPIAVWKCSICLSQTFDTYEAACVHEKNCLQGAARSLSSGSSTSRSRRQSGRILAKEMCRRDKTDDEKRNLSAGTKCQDLSVTPEDRARLSDFNAMLLDNIELFVVDEAFNAQIAEWASANLQGGVASAKLRPNGTVGFRCKHCRHLPLLQQAPSSVSFPGKIPKLGCHAHYVGSSHFQVCQFIPEHTRQALTDAKEWSKSQSTMDGNVGLNKFLIEKARAWGLRNASISSGSGASHIAIKFRDSIVSLPDRKELLAKFGSGASRRRRGHQKHPFTIRLGEEFEHDGEPHMSSRRLPARSDRSTPKSSGAILDMEADGRVKKRARYGDDYGDSGGSDDMRASKNSQRCTVKPSKGPRTVGGQHFRLFIPGEDEKHLSPLQCYMRRHCVEAFVVDTDELLAQPKGNRRISVGQVGIRCVFCKSLPWEEREKRHVVYPSGTHGLYDAYTKLTMVHSSLCKKMPKLIQQQIKDLKINGMEGSLSPRDYYRSSAKTLGLRDSQNGIMMSRSQNSSSGLVDTCKPISSKDKTRTTTGRNTTSSDKEPDKKRDVKTTSLKGTDGKHKGSTKRDSEATTDKPTCFPLSSPDDKDFLNELHCFARTLLEVFTIESEEDADVHARQGSPIIVGRVGMRCIYCMDGEGSGKVKFPSSLSDIYHVTRKFMYDHFDHCPTMPKGVSSQYLKLRKKKIPRKGQTSSYYAEAAQRMGLYDMPRDGVAFDRSFVHDLEPTTLNVDTSVSEKSSTVDAVLDEIDDGGFGSVTMPPSSPPQNSQLEELLQTVVSPAERAQPAPNDEPTSGSGEQDANLIKEKPPPTPGTLAALVLPEERGLMTDFKYAVLNQLNVCYFTANDRKTGNREGIGLGFPGVGCRHCVARKFFASSGKTMAKSALPSTYGHFTECPKVPTEIRIDITLKKRRDESDKRKLPKGAYWPLHERLWERMLKSAVNEKHLTVEAALAAAGHLQFNDLQVEPRSSSTSDSGETDLDKEEGKVDNSTELSGGGGTQIPVMEGNKVAATNHPPSTTNEQQNFVDI